MVIQINEEKVIQIHKDRIEAVILNSKLKDISDNWYVYLSDSVKNRVYLTDCNSKNEYSVYFLEDNIDGYEYTVFARQELSDDLYNKLIKSRPELKEMSRKSLATVKEIDRKFIHEPKQQHKNAFKELLDSMNIDCTKFNTHLLLGISSVSNLSHFFIQVIPDSKECMVVGNLSRAKLDKAIEYMSTISNMSPNTENNMIAEHIFLEGYIDLFLEEAISYLKSIGYEVSRMSASEKI